MKILALLAALFLAVPASAETVVVQQIGFFFSPREVVVQPGDSVRFVWTSGTHTVTEGVDGVVNGNEAFTSSLTSGTSSYTVTFSDAFLAANPRVGDRYPYFCAPHFSIQMNGVVQVARPVPGTAGCFGTVAACPCGNGSTGPVGCLNSVLTGGRMAAFGAARTSADTLQLSITGLPEGNNVLFYQGATTGAGTVFGDGVRCAAGTLVRLGVKTVSFGVARYPETGDAGVALRGLVQAGTTRVYQGWYRDGAGACGNTSTNFTNSYSINWQP